MSELKHKVVVPLDGGREFTIWLPKPAAELSAIEIHEIVEALKRDVSRRGQA